jgi:N-acetylglucosaminyldiphosphoundecaprenol N-acetyl-beta-D-mannosaminyltransferase
MAMQQVEVVDRFSIQPVPTVSIFGVKFTNASKHEAFRLMEQLIQQSTSAQIFLPNAHTLNLAVKDPAYHATLNQATYVFGDGTGVRIAARLRGTQMKSNLVGTDLIPEFFQATANRGYRYFLLGADAQTIKRAADYAEQQFPGWELAGFHHGYLNTPERFETAIAQIKAAKPHILLVGMGNPLQEKWIEANQFLDIPIQIGVGGLFDHWGGNLQRAPRWVRYLGAEWLQILFQQPQKWRRYLIGNFAFLWYTVAYLKSDLSPIVRTKRRKYSNR